jgi:hypothetical protein
MNELDEWDQALGLTESGSALIELIERLKDNG